MAGPMRCSSPKIPPEGPQSPSGYQSLSNSVQSVWRHSKGLTSIWEEVQPVHLKLRLVRWNWYTSPRNNSTVDMPATLSKWAACTTTPSIDTFQLSDLPGFTPSPIATRKHVKVPRSRDKKTWLELNIQIAGEVVPKVFDARSLEEKCEALTTGIYHLLSNLTPSQPTKQKPQHKPHNRQLKGVTERKKQLKKDLREANRMNAPWVLDDPQGDQPPEQRTRYTAPHL